MRFRRYGLGLALFAASFPLCARAQKAEPAPQKITLPEAVQLALKHNHVVRIAGLQVQEKQHAKEAARSGYFPSITNESRVLHVTDTQFIQIPAGSLGTVGGSSNSDAAGDYQSGWARLLSRAERVWCSRSLSCSQE